MCLNVIFDCAGGVAAELTLDAAYDLIGATMFWCQSL